ncbi:MAG: hypothetical protein WC860_00200 [Candidatus Margulisiibacteriota bacterium]|jgi:hypothetical protein
MEAWLDKIGLIFIACGWLFQLIAMLKSKNAKISMFFIIPYIIGSIILIYDQSMMGLKGLSNLNILVLVFCLLVLLLMVRRKFFE